MAVYTPLADGQLRAWLAQYSLGDLVSFQGIAEGVENSNFLLETTQGRFILTLFERRMDPAELPWFLELMGVLAAAGLSCPQPVPAKNGQTLGKLADKPAVIVSFLQGRSLMAPPAWACEEAGRAMAQLHAAGRDFIKERPNRLALDGWQALLESCANASPERETADMQVLLGEAQEAFARLQVLWPERDTLPRGQIHADLFPDNVFFLPEEQRLSGLIDFYFACTDFLAYDIAIVLNAWCFEEQEGGDVRFDPEKASAVLRGYEEVRPLEAAERAVLPILCQGAALRFLLTRLYDWSNTPADALVTPKDPRVYGKRLQHFAKNGLL